REGLARLPDSRWPGVRASVAQAKLGAEVSAREVAFVLAPRLNAAGRLGEADLGLELLTTPSERRARELAVYLDARNAERRKIQDDMYQAALAKADPEAPALVLEDPSWHPGVMGIVASKLLETFYLPVYIAADGKGSVRSTPGISAVAGLRAAAAHLKRYGGHQQAAGFALDMAEFEGFKAAIHGYVSRYPRPVPTVVADAVIAAEEINDGLWHAIRQLEPYGEGHPAPLFALVDRLDMARAVGKGGTTLPLRRGGAPAAGRARRRGAGARLRGRKARRRPASRGRAAARAAARRPGGGPRAPRRRAGGDPRPVARGARGAGARGARLPDGVGATPR